MMWRFTARSVRYVSIGSAPKFLGCCIAWKCRYDLIQWMYVFSRLGACVMKGSSLRVNVIFHQRDVYLRLVCCKLMTYMRFLGLYVDLTSTKR
ncbi:MAG: hypothetical protein ACI81G_001699 [Gammaproteobacteria bacterium]|jgi:hypothetical protein